MSQTLVAHNIVQRYFQMDGWLPTVTESAKVRVMSAMMDVV